MTRIVFAGLLLCSLPLYAADDAATADADLNATYRSLTAKLEGGNLERLRDAQRAWVAFRDKECAFKAQGQNDAGVARAAHAACVTELTQQRTQQLRREIDCPADDASCVPRKVAVATAPATKDAAGSCRAEVGAAKAEEYVAQCQQVSPATHPPCNVANACELIVDEIKRGCAMIDKNAPAFCAQYR
jgi:hypothetical protein